jgi:hypothetical protein
MPRIILQKQQTRTPDMKKLLLTGMCAALAAALLQPAASGKPDSISPEESDRVIALAFEKGLRAYKNYSGIESVRKEVMSEYDPATNRLRSVSEVTMKRKDYFYKNPEVEILTYKKDGKTMETSKYRVRNSMPLYPIFDDKGRDNYLITVAEKIKYNGRQCYRIQVDPRKTTSRHFKGSIYIALNNMEVVGIDGTMAKLDFPIKEFRIVINTSQTDDVPITQSGEVHVRINVPLFYPDTMIVSVITTLESRLMQ